ncbi:MAG: hypothetical protein JXR11_03695 [Balneola sp.]
MNDYSDVLQVIGAMLLVSLLVQSANRSNLANTQLLISNEYEVGVTAIAQDIMEESRVLAFDEETVTGFVPVNIPSDFSNIGLDGSENGNNKNTFDDFDDYDGYTGTVTTDLGSFDVEISVYYLDSSYNSTNSKTTLKEMSITISNRYLTENDGTTLKRYTFSTIRSYYAE